MNGTPAFDLTYRKQSFQEAFAQARRMGLKVFVWDGRIYHTLTREEELRAQREDSRRAAVEFYQGIRRRPRTD